MAFTTYAAFVPALMDMTVAGVRTYKDEPPTQISTAQLPMMYPRIPTGSNEIITTGGSAGLSMATCELVIVIEPRMQNMHGVNFAASLALMDAMETALTTNALAIGIDRWQMQIVEDDLGGDTVYWLLVTTVEAS